MDQWLDKGAAECRKTCVTGRIQNSRCRSSDGTAIWNNHIVRSLQTDSRWKSRRIGSAPSRQSFVSDFLAFANRQSRRRQATLHATHTTQPYTRSMRPQTSKSTWTVPSSVQQLCFLRPDSGFLAAAVCQERALGVLRDCPIFRSIFVTVDRAFGSISCVMCISHTVEATHSAHSYGSD
jgi:hypothetical protein